MMRVLLIVGLILIGFDVARLNMTGVAMLGVVFLILAAFLAGVFTRDFWISDNPEYGRIDQQLEHERMQ